MRHFFLTIFCIMAISANAARLVDGINYDVDRDKLTATVIKLDNYEEYTGDIVIPARLTLGSYTFSVVSIGVEAFQSSPITSISLPETIVEIKDYAFQYCSYLKELSLPNSITSIGERAFKDCESITKLKLPNNDVKIGTDAFSGLISIQELIIPDNWTQIGYENGSGFFDNCTSLRKLTIGKKVKTIWFAAFSDCTSLKEVVCPEDGALTAIENSAFASCISLTSMKFIPRTVKTIGVKVFANCDALEEVFIPNSVEEIGGGEWNVKTTKFIMEDGSTPFFMRSGRGLIYPTEAYLGRPMDASKTKGQPIWNRDLKKLTFGPFFKGGEKWDFGKNVKEIYSYVTDPSVITYKFDENVYDNATLYVPKGTKSAYMAQSNFAPFFDIREMAGQKPEVGSRYTIGADNNKLHYRVINNSTMEVELESGDYTAIEIIIPKTVEIEGYTYTVTSIGDYAFREFFRLTSVTIPNSVTNIGYMAFNGCSGLTSMNIPNSVTNIEIAAFAGCSSLTSVTIPNSVTKIKMVTFAGCSSLTSVTIPNSVTDFGTEVFKGCSSLTSVIIPNSVKLISGGTFQGCTSLTTVIIPNSVVNVMDGAFDGCTSLNDVYCYAEHVPYSGRDNSAFINSSIGEATLHVPASAINDYKNTAPWSGFGKIVSLGGDSSGDEDQGGHFFNGQIVMTRKVFVHHYDDYNYSGITFAFNNGKNLDLRYFNTDYWQGWNNPIRGIYIMSSNADDNVNDYGDYHNANRQTKEWYIAPIILDEWFTEKLVIHTDGRVQYYLNDEYMGEEIFDDLNLSEASSFNIEMSPWGWWTGMYTYMDDFFLSTPSATISDNFNDGVIDFSIWKEPINPDGVREEDGIIKMEQLRTDENFCLYIENIPLALKEGDPSGIEVIKNGQHTTDDTPLYNLNGLRVEKAAKGIYIKNGRKVLVK